MVSKVFDVAVAGLGIMGSAALAECARRGVSCVGFDRFARGHAMGSSSGRSRIIRQAYFEHSAYVPLLRRAYELWERVERETQTRLVTPTGLLMVGDRASALIAGSLQSAREFAIPVDILDQEQVQRAYPLLHIRNAEIAVFEPSGGVLNPEAAVAAQLRLAGKFDAQLCFEAALESWNETRDAIEVRLSDGSLLHAKTLIAALGPWSSPFLNSLGIHLRIQRNVQAWFEPASDAYGTGRLPAFMVDRDDLPALLYGFPDMGDGIKAALHAYGEDTDADGVDRQVRSADIEAITRAMNAWMPGAAGPLRDAKVCMYAITRDKNFAIGFHPQSRRVVVLAGFSGHGFKFGSVAGEIAAQLALDGGTAHPIQFLALNRLR